MPSHNPRSPTPAHAPPIGAWPATWWAEIALTLAVGLAYSNSFQGEFIFDDDPSILQNETIRQLWPLTSVLWSPTTRGITTDGRPLLNLSLAINYWISGTDVWSYHALNLLVHVLATLALFGLALRTLSLVALRSVGGFLRNPRPVSEKPAYTDRSVMLAFAIALIWGLHPLQTESVTYIIQRAESMVGLFYLLTLYCVARGELSLRPGLWHFLAVLACLAGVASKEVIVTAPVVVLLYLWTFTGEALGPMLRRRWKLLAALVGAWLPLMVIVVAIGFRGGTAGSHEQLGPTRYAATQLVAVVHYLRLCFWPRPLVLDYGMAVVDDRFQIIVCGVILAVLIGSTLWALWRRSWIGFLGSAFFLILSPTSSVVPIWTQTMTEHRMYLSLACVVALFVLLLDLGCRRLPSKQSGDSPRVLPAVLLAAVALLMGRETWLRNQDYRTAISIWQDNVDDLPDNERALRQLYLAHFKAGNLETALVHADRAIGVHPGTSYSYNDRGIIHLQLQHFEQAAADFEYCVKLEPGFAEGWINRGIAQAQLGRTAEAVADFSHALKLKPDYRDAYRNRAIAFSQLGRTEEARADALRFVQQGGALTEALRRILSAP